MPITPAKLPRNAEEVVDSKAFFDHVIPLYERGVGEIDAKLAAMSPEQRAEVEVDWAKTRKYWQANEKQGKEPGYFGIFIDPTKCKGCAECVQVCDDHALKMIKKTDA